MVDGVVLDTQGDPLLEIQSHMRAIEERVGVVENGVQQWMLLAGSSRSDQMSNGHVSSLFDVPPSLPVAGSLEMAPATTVGPPGIFPSLSGDGYLRLPKRKFDPLVYTKCLRKPASSLVFDESIISVLDREGYPDVIQRGLATRQQVALAFQMCVHVPATYCPFKP